MCHSCNEFDSDTNYLFWGSYPQTFCLKQLYLFYVREVRYKINPVCTIKLSSLTLHWIPVPVFRDTVQSSIYSKLSSIVLIQQLKESGKSLHWSEKSELRMWSL